MRCLSFDGTSASPDPCTAQWSTVSSGVGPTNSGVANLGNIPAGTKVLLGFNEPNHGATLCSSRPPHLWRAAAMRVVLATLRNHCFVPAHALPSMQWAMSMQC